MMLLNEIEPNLYLGNIYASIDKDILCEHKITHILTINDYCSPSPENITTKFIRLSDQPNEDLICWFEETNAFIKEALSKGTVLVHCFMGVSRSATVVIAYIMKKYRLTYDEAFKKVQQKREQVYPNEGFVDQLKLYHEMDYKVDHNNVNYKLFRLRNASHSMMKEYYLPKQFMDLIKPDPENVVEINDIYCCKKCERILATGDNLISHQAKGTTCSQMYTFEPLEWMKVTNRIDGKLLCPKCDTEVGTFAWIRTTFCPCGAEITPTFQLKPTAVANKKLML